MLLKANAKINLYLDIVGKRPDGYHNIETVFQEIEIYDELQIVAENSSQNNFNLSCNNSELATDENILKKAYDKLLPYFNKTLGLRVNLTKNVPTGAGLGGGSSDCACFISSLLTIADIKISNEMVLKIASNLGADVPFFFYGGTCVGRGIGDIIEKISSKLGMILLIVNPKIHVNTKEAYAGCIIGSEPGGLKNLIEGLASGDIEKISGFLYNGFEKSVFKNYPEIQQCKEDLKMTGAIGSLMSGSGSTCFGIYHDVSSARNAEEFFKKKNYFTKVVNTVIR